MVIFLHSNRTLTQTEVGTGVGYCYDRLDRAFVWRNMDFGNIRLGKYRFVEDKYTQIVLVTSLNIRISGACQSVTYHLSLRLHVCSVLCFWTGKGI